MTYFTFVLLLSLTTVSPISVTRVFDGRNCPGISNSGNATIRYLEVLPGYGFDALSNLPMGQVFFHNYSTCKVTKDGKYLIPDSVSVTPVRENHYQLYAELFEHWSSYTPLTSSKINVDLPIFGFFSEEKQMIKKKQGFFNSVVRTAFRNKAYEVREDIISELHPDFKSRVYEIAAYEQNNDTELAAYYSEKLINDYGTHYITAVNAGALIVKLDCLSKLYIDTTNEESIKSAAFLSFPYYEQISKEFNLRLDIAIGYSQGQSDQYRRNVQKLDILTMGGASLTPNFNFSTWLREIPDNMVTVERYGKQLHNAISTSLFPELLTTTTRKVSRYVEAAIEKYIDINEKQVNKQLGSRRFNARVSSDQDNPFMGFGGVYIACPSTNIGHCRIARFNTLGDTAGRCPLSYNSFPLYSGYYSNNAKEVDLSWCAAFDSSSVVNKGFLFGGFHSNIRVNPLTGARSCGPYFDEIDLLLQCKLKLCLSSDHKNAQAKAVGFGGFFSCKYGNPFALPLDANPLKSIPRLLPHSCPTGYSQYLMATWLNCSIHVCLEDDNFDLDTLKHPPFTVNIAIDARNDLQIKGSGGTILRRNTGGKWESFFDSNSTCQSESNCRANHYHKKKVYK